MSNSKPKSLAETLKDAPSNWGRWGPDDEIGAVNYLTREEVLRGIKSVRTGKVFALGAPVGRPEGDPIFPSRGQPKKYMAMDKGFYLNGRAEPFPGGLEYADDVMFMFVQGTTQYDAPGHTWYDETIYNGHDAKTTIGGLQKCGMAPMAEHGVVGRGVLLDVPRYKGVEYLGPGEQITLADLKGCAERQGLTIRKRDIPVIRTGWLKVFYEQGPEVFFPEGSINEPGITDEPELIQWFHEMEIPSFSTDTIANEQTRSSVTGIALPLHGALLRNLGIAFNEIAWVEDLARDCAEDGQYDFLFVGAPLKIIGGTGSPVNPTVIK